MDIPGYTSVTDNIKPLRPPGPYRTIARRGTEIFVAVGKEIRWADLVYLKENWDELQSKTPRKAGKGKASIENQSEEQNGQGYRVSSPALTVFLQLTFQDHQNPSRGGHSTAYNFSACQLHRDSNDTYGPYCHPTRAFTTQYFRYERSQVEILYPWTYNACYISVWNSFSVMASSGC